MEIRYQVIYKVICAWNIAIYKRIRDVSKAEAEMLVNSPFVPEMVDNGSFKSRIENIRKTSFDYRYLVYMKVVNLAEFKIPRNCRLIVENELQEAMKWAEVTKKKKRIDNSYVTFFN